MKKLIVLLLFPLFLFNCESPADSANRREREQVNRAQETMVRNQPPPVFDWSLERHLMTQLYRARNERMLTYTYVFNRNGGLLFSCDSMGFPIPATTQLTNPQTLAWNAHGTSTVAQAEPNGLYAPPDTDGTYVMCLGDHQGVVEPVYIEDRVITTTRRMVMVDGRLTPAPGSFSPTQLRTSR